MSEHPIRRAYDYLRNAQLSIGVSAVMAAMNVMDRQVGTVYANDPFGEQAVRAIPSAFPAPDITGNLAADVSLQVASTFAASELSRTTSSTKQIVGTAIAAQVLSCGVDAGVDRSGWLTGAERAQPDIGFSAISAAWVSKYLLDRADRAKTPLRQHLWQAGMAAFAGSLTVGSYYLFGRSGKLDLSSHATGVAVGTAAHYMGKRNHSQPSSVDQPEYQAIGV